MTKMMLPRFVDTSAFYAFLDESDRQHTRAVALWRRLVDDEVKLLTTSYVVAECTGLLQRRLGMAAVRRLQQMLEIVQIAWVEESYHSSGMSMLLREDRRKLSLVDCVSFVAMRGAGVDTAFAFDDHFTEQGFRLLS